MIENIPGIIYLGKPHELPANYTMTQLKFSTQMKLKIGASDWKVRAPKESKESVGTPTTTLPIQISI